MQLETNVLHIEFTAIANFQPLTSVGLLHPQFTGRILQCKYVLVLVNQGTYLCIILSSWSKQC